MKLIFGLIWYVFLDDDTEPSLEPRLKKMKDESDTKGNILISSLF